MFFSKMYCLVGVNKLVKDNSRQMSECPKKLCRQNMSTEDLRPSFVLQNKPAYGLFNSTCSGKFWILIDGGAYKRTNSSAPRQPKKDLLRHLGRQSLNSHRHVQLLFIKASKLLCLSYNYSLKLLTTIKWYKHLGRYLITDLFRVTKSLL